MLIGITGRAGCGKNTLADAIAKESGGGVIAFADALRDVVEAAFGSRYETQAEKASVDEWWQTRLHGARILFRPLLGDEPVTGRRILQYIGTELFRNHVHPDFWLIAMERRLAQPEYQNDLVVVPDVRFENEARFIRERKGVVLHLKRQDQIDAPRMVHVSEREISPDLVDEVYVSRSADETQTLGAVIARQYAPRAADRN